MADFFHMGGYGFYVWVSYGLTLVILAWNLISPIRREHRLMDQLARQLRRRNR